MKNIFILFAILLLLASCSEKEDSLSGSKWERHLPNWNETVEFTSGRDCQVFRTKDGALYDTVHYGTYTYVGGVISFDQVYSVDYLAPSNTRHYFLSATISGNLMTITANTETTKYERENGEFIPIETIKGENVVFTYKRIE